MSWERMRAVADAVLFEGYALYPYRPTAAKNQLRWQFGVLLPRAASEAGGPGGEPWWNETQLLYVPGASEEPRGKLRFLRARRRVVERATGEPVDSLEVDGQLLVSWDEGEICELDFDLPLDGGARTLPFSFDGDQTEERVRGATGGVAARVVRTRAPLAGRGAWSSRRSRWRRPSPASSCACASRISRPVRRRARRATSFCARPRSARTSCWQLAAAHFSRSSIRRRGRKRPRAPAAVWACTPSWPASPAART
jgi:hypothetical protein